MEAKDKYSDLCIEQKVKVEDFRIFESYQMDCNCILQNIRSVNYNFDQFLLTISMMGMDFDVIGLVETWSRYGNVPPVAGYKVYEGTSNINKSSGVALLVKENYDSGLMDFKDNVDMGEMFDMLFIKVRGQSNLDSKKGDCIFGVCYRSPTSNMSNFITFWESLLNNLMLLNTNVILMGDINIDFKKDNNPNSSACNFIANNCGFRLINDIPTRYTQMGGSLIDVVFTNVCGNTNSVVVDTCITDHCSVVASFLLGSEWRNNSEAKINDCIKESYNYDNIILELLAG